MTSTELLHAEHESILKSQGEIQSEWKTFKNRALLTLLMGIGTFVGYGIWIGETQTRILHTEQDVDKITIQVESAISGNNELRVRLAGIEASLANITATLVEIKNRQR